MAEINFTNIQKTAIECMTNNRQLNSFLFDSSSQLHKDMQPSFLRIGEFVYDYVKDMIPNITLDDIVFQGSSVNYTYNPKSDLDLHILCSHPKFNAKELEGMLDAISYELMLLGYKTSIKNKLVDYTAFSYIKGISSGIYSVLNRKWIEEPVRQEFEFSYSDICDAVIKMRKDTENFIRELSEEYKDNCTFEQCDKMREYFDNMRLNAYHSASNGKKEYDFNYTAFRTFRKCGEYNELRNYMIIQHKSVVENPMFKHHKNSIDL